MPVLQYDISVVGVQNVERAMASIEQRFMAHNRRMAAAVAREANRPEMRAASRSVARGGGGGGVDREAQAAARAAAQLDRQRSSALLKEYRTRERLEAKEARDKERAAAQLDRQRSAALFKQHRERERLEARTAREGARAAVRAQAEFRRRTGAVLGAGMDSAIGIGKTALAVTGLGGGALIASKLSGAASLEKSQRALSVAGGGAMSYDQIRNKVANTSIATGQSQEDVTLGMREYVSATGNLAEASDSIGTFATVAQAAEANVADVAKAAAYLSTAMNVSAKDMPDALAKLYFQGKKGAFELKDLGAAIPQLGSQAATLGMSGVEGMTTLGGLAQIAQKGTGNAAEAQTALSNLFNQIVAKSDKLQSGEAFGGHKVQVFEGGDPKNKMNNIRQILADMLDASGGNVQQLLSFGEIRGSKALNPMVNAYKAAGGGVAGRDAVLKMIEDASAASGTFADVQKDAAETMKSANVQLEILNTQMTAAVQKELLPALVKLGPHVMKLIPYFSKMVETLAHLMEKFANNPIGNIGDIIVAKVSYDLAAAAIGPKIRDTLTGLISGGTGQGGPGGKPGFLGGAGVLGNALAAVAITALTIETIKAGMLVIDEFMPTNKGDVEKGVEKFNEEQKATASGKVGDLVAMRDEYQRELNNPEFKSKDPLLSLAQSFGSQPGTGPDAGIFGQALAKEKAQHDAELQKSIDRLSKAIGNLTMFPPTQPPNRTNSPSPVK